MDRALIKLVWKRARSLCEYCQMPQNFDSFTHEIDHAIAKKHGGLTVAGNLVLACFPCNNRKGPNIAGIDPDTKKADIAIQPSTASMVAPFPMERPQLIGKTAIGRVTTAVLEINAPERVLIRQTLIEEGVFPPKEPG